MASAQDQATMEFAKSLSKDEIPAKLRCTSCNNLAVNAVKLPCCDQSICEDCQASLPESCPICMHSPLSAADCKPNKSLRLTIKAFLRAEEKKRGKTSTPAQSTPTPAPLVETPVAPPEPQAEATEPESTQPISEEVVHDNAEAGTEADTSLPVADGNPEETTDQAEALISNDAAQANTQITDDNDEADDDDVAIFTGDEPVEATIDERTTEDNAPADTTQAEFSNTNFNPAMNPMMAMGMQNPGFGGFSAMMPMGMGMGMPNMFGFNGMGMNMNMNMGMGNGFGGGWNGAQQDMNGGGQYGFYPNGGYDNQLQAPFGNQRQFPNQNYSNRFRGAHRPFGRGRGGFRGHGNFYQQNQQYGHQQQGWNNNNGYQVGQNGHDGEGYENGANAEQSADTEADGQNGMVADNDAQGGNETGAAPDADQEMVIGDHDQQRTNNGHHDQQSSLQFSNGRGGYQGSGRGDAQNQAPMAAPPLNAPTGPKAMRQGGARQIAIRQDSGDRRRSSAAISEQASVQETPDHPENASLQQQPRSHSRDTKRSHRERSRSRSIDKHPRDHERRRRHEDEHEDRRAPRASRNDRSRSRSRSRSPDDRGKRHSRTGDRDKYRSSRSHRDSSREANRSRRDKGRDDDDDDRARRRESRRERERSDRHRDSTRDLDDERDRRSERREKDSRKSRQSQPEGSPEDDLSRSIEAFRRKRSENERPKDKPRDATTGGSDDVGFKIKGSRSAPKAEPGSEAPFAPPTGPRKDRDRRGSMQSPAETRDVPAAAPADPYALEREARQKERMAREQKRRESATLGKRGRGDGDGFDPPTGPRGGRSGRDSEYEEGAGRKKGRHTYAFEDGEGDDGRDDGRWR